MCIHAELALFELLQEIEFSPTLTEPGIGLPINFLPEPMYFYFFIYVLFFIPLLVISVNFFAKFKNKSRIEQDF